jgi:hypothetical protein
VYGYKGLFRGTDEIIDSGEGVMEAVFSRNGMEAVFTTGSENPEPALMHDDNKKQKRRRMLKVLPISLNSILTYY